MNSDQPKTPPLASRWVKCRNPCWGLLIGLTWLATLIHLTIRDEFVATAVCYYATPPLALGLVMLILARLGSRWQRHRLVNRGTVLIGWLWLAFWGVTDFRWERQHEPRTNTARLLFWNVGRSWFASWDRIAERVAQFDADIVALAEVTGSEQQTREYWLARLPGYFPLPLDGGLLVLVKGEVRLHDTWNLAGAGHSCLVNVTLKDTRFDLLVADLISNPLQPRQPPLRRLLEIARDHDHKPTVIVGDFNTPPTSSCFVAWRKAGLHRAWDDAGDGYQSTWPLPFPVLALDHVWGSQQVVFQRCTIAWSSCSDHRPVLVDISVQR